MNYTHANTTQNVPLKIELYEEPPKLIENQPDNLASPLSQQNILVLAGNIIKKTCRTNFIFMNCIIF